MCPFQCDLCWFRNLERRDPTVGSYTDKRLLGYIRRVNLDIIWSRSPGTIASNRQGILNIIKVWRELDLTVDLPAIGPWPVEDKQGFRLAIAHLKLSQREGKNKSSHLQYDSIRKLRTAFTHLHETSVEGTLAEDGRSFKGQRGDSLKLSTSPTESRLFTMFMRGLLLRMGRQTETNEGLEYKVLLEILKVLEHKLSEAEGICSQDTRRMIIMVGSMFVIGFVMALRGNELFMVDAKGLWKHRNEGRTEMNSKLNHVVVPLLGRFKNEDNQRLHLMVSVENTLSGIQVRLWVDRLIGVLHREDNLSGPAFCKRDGTLLDYWVMNQEFIKLIEQVQSKRPDLIEADKDVPSSYSIYRSIRRGSTARAMDMEVDSNVIDLHNRWRSIENRGGQRSNKSMRDYYTDLRLTLNLRLKYSRAL